MANKISGWDSAGIDELFLINAVVERIRVEYSGSDVVAVIIMDVASGFCAGRMGGA